MWAQHEGVELVLGKDIIVDRLDSCTHTQEATDIFSCWVWCWSLDRIPSDYGFTVFPKGAGRVEEMHGYSPPHRQVAPPPEGIQFSALIHIDLVEDCTVREARPSSSRQSSLPSSSSDKSAPLPAVQPYTWYFNVRDGEEIRLARRRNDSCGAYPPAARRNHDDEGDDRLPRSYRDSVLPRDTARTPTPSRAGLGADEARHCSRTPASRRCRAPSVPSDATPTPASETFPPPPPLPLHSPMPQRLDLAAIAPAPVSVPSASLAPTSPTSSSSEDPLVELMATERLEHTGWPACGFDPMALERDAFCEATLSSPLSFPPVPAFPALAGGGGTGAPSPLGFSMPPRDDIDMHVSAAGTDAEHDASDRILDALFAAHPFSVLGATPPPPPPCSRGGKDKTPVTPRRSAR
ncbi:WAS/WASL-interacting protein family member 2-like [Brachypodium distachyon]|uniref:WAS/WASL-interacting protein family member 2-like n=1 Tax=Brachypodium distachyon TaxID=15368 RepID=UPI000D0D2934|nr:WAS/WASL-interacting protein family member 2-like [Brachypodium distachyon]|eukprot:XP_024314496.1 WAS/WASL-interacting protein family member 2-like [Brachypodium distachyon]